MAERRDVEFQVDGGEVLRGWLFAPEEPGGPRPAISMAHGYAGVKEQGIEPFARAFAAAGIVVLLHDHRNFGTSDGAIRQDVDPWRQIADWRRAISFLESQPEVDAERIGVWGTSYAGGHVIVLGATDRRIRAVVAQVPTISGFEQGLRRIPPDGVAAIENVFAEDERAQFRGDLGLPCVSPTPLLIIVALNDTITVTDLALVAYERALQPKKLVTIPGGHFDPYLGQFPKSSEAAVAWFKEHLG